MMIMRPQQQQRHGRGSTRGSSAAAVWEGLGVFRAEGHGKPLVRPCDVGGAMAVGEQSVMADAV